LLFRCVRHDSNADVTCRREDPKALLIWLWLPRQRDLDRIGEDVEGAGGNLIESLLGEGDPGVEMSFADLESGRPPAARKGPINGKQDPAQAVAAGVFQINTAVSTFQRLVNTLGTPKDTPELREKL
ncbi:hypothetical protein Taro_003132, partial [Colocasia esculenta]|nr:hypothetical protein [Colocasia esculenta]